MPSSGQPTTGISIKSLMFGAKYLHSYYWMKHLELMIKSITNISWLESMTLIVPGNLRYDAEIETLYSDINKTSDLDEPILLDGSYLNWVEPYSLISLISGCRWLYQSTKQKIVLRRLRDDVHRYLERMDVCDI
ncbi:MAG: hypothetical protein AAFQ07_06115 [Chloroflexota bacterium]